MSISNMNYQIRIFDLFTDNKFVVEIVNNLLLKIFGVSTIIETLIINAIDIINKKKQEIYSKF